jgi:ABC-type Fe3+/spermidine/putrescine transport system ATPase subunit
VDAGKIVEIGEKWKVYYQPKNIKLAGLLGEYNVIRKEDFEKESKNKLKAKSIFRPDKISLNSSKEALKLQLTISNCTYNGKCYEVLAETKNGHSVIFYSAKAISIDKNVLAFASVV